MSIANSIAIVVLAIAFILHVTQGMHGEHWFALDGLARKLEELERRLNRIQRERDDV